ncbi:hypothetical protein SY83_22210 [Paenibacillus swuensis]|uniref:Uncharacterized protein n=1 Tax=Paenibacillus swuensis TaxID=1178515 RepID=A0A172TP07_9BACL|nr:DUF2161 family putative PD-(D/E)XK-type phosphodiesterase [Paenibacillus swuensis]ANE48547.1 hypothetical protein SY83_22210 [Paenibacillus swuensis]
MAVREETELCAPVKSFFEARGFAVKSEVRGCDLVGVHPEAKEPVIVELKKTFNLALLFQGMERLRMSGNVYLAVERNRAKKGAHNQRWSDIVELCQRLGLGFITVTFYVTKKPLVEVLCEPSAAGAGVPAAKRSRVRASKLLYEFAERSGDYNVGGSTKRKLVTAYREKALQIAYHLEQHGRLSPVKLRELTGSPKAAGILQKDYYGWFRRAQRGVYELTPEGKAALTSHAEVISGFSGGAN